VIEGWIAIQVSPGLYTRFSVTVRRNVFEVSALRARRGHHQDAHIARVVQCLSDILIIRGGTEAKLNNVRLILYGVSNAIDKTRSGYRAVAVVDLDDHQADFVRHAAAGGFNRNPRASSVGICASQPLGREQMVKA